MCSEFLSTRISSSSVCEIAWSYSVGRVLWGEAMIDALELLGEGAHVVLNSLCRVQTFGHRSSRVSVEWGERARTGDKGRGRELTFFGLPLCNRVPECFPLLSQLPKGGVEFEHF